MSSQSQTIPLRMRLLAIILGMVFLFWLPFEDQTVLISIAFAAAFCTCFAIIYILQSKKSHPVKLKQYIFAGTIAGALITPLTLLLMAIKTGLHGHLSPDFTMQQILAVIRKTPVWILGGFLISLGSGIWIIHREK